MQEQLVSSTHVWSQLPVFVFLFLHEHSKEDGPGATPSLSSTAYTLSAMGSRQTPALPSGSFPRPPSEPAASGQPASFSPPVFYSWLEVLIHESRAQRLTHRRCVSSGFPCPSVSLPSHKEQTGACSLLSCSLISVGFWWLSYFLWHIRH